MMTMTESNTAVVFTEAAAKKVQELLLEEGNPDLSLRVSIAGGGCAGFRYGIDFSDSLQPDDFILEKELDDLPADFKDRNVNGSLNPFFKVRLIIDPISLAYLRGAQIDYREDIHGSQFIIRNPNAKTTCGCGSSFDA